VQEIGRNDSCFCGSGKKYKKCCLPKEEAAATRRRGEAAAARTALEWLIKKYPDEIHVSINGVYYNGIKKAEKEALNGISAPFHEILNVNIGEWLIADADIRVGDQAVAVSQLLQNDDGPQLGSAGQRWISRLAAQPLSLYEVQGVNPGEGFFLIDLLRDDGEVVWVREKSASHRVVRWDTFGARLVRAEEETVLSGALYPFDRAEALACQTKIMRKIKGVDRDSTLIRDVCGKTIIHDWLRRILAEQACSIRETCGSKGSMGFVIDHLRVHDWNSLSSLLDQLDDVEGDRARGWRMPGQGRDETNGGITSLLPGKKDSLILFSSTINLADETLSRLRSVVGDSVAHMLREVSDECSFQPLEVMNESSGRTTAGEAENKLLNEMMVSFYTDWADTPIPALGDKTPRRAIATAAGRRLVIEILKTFERNDQRRVSFKGGDAFDFGFLWHTLGLER